MRLRRPKWFFCPPKQKQAVVLKPWERSALQGALSSMRLLLSSSAADWLMLTRPRGLFLRQGRWAKAKTLLLTIVTFGRSDAKIYRALELVFLRFLSEAYNPLKPALLREVLQRKRALFFRALERLRALSQGRYASVPWEAYWSSYERATYLQIAIIRRVDSATSKPSKARFYQAAAAAIKAGGLPCVMRLGMSGSYFIADRTGKWLGLFKPFDEESWAPNNPRRQAYRGPLGTERMRPGLLSGEGCHREVAASVVDRFLGLGIVPHTVYARFRHFAFYDPMEGPRALGRRAKEKSGSFQAFIEQAIHLGRRSLELVELQKLALLDVVIGNLDRHTHNILYDGKQIWAIDNALSFSSRSLGGFRWEWQKQEAASQPFTPAMRALIESMDVERLMVRLRKACFLTVNTVERMRERIALLRAACCQGMAPAQLALLMTARTLCPLHGLRRTLDEQAAAAVRETLLNQKDQGIS